MALRRVLFTIVVAVFSTLSLSVAFLLGRSSWENERPSQPIRQLAAYELARAIPPHGLKLAGRDDCTPPTETETALLQTAVDVLAFPHEMSRSLGNGSMRLLSSPLIRRGEEAVFFLCDDQNIFQTAQMYIQENEHLLKGRLTEFGFALIGRLPSPSADLARKVAESAFSDTPQESDSLRRDLRPLARATLASIKGASTPYADRAFSEITIENSMGTGAAQIAVAGGHPQALAKVELLMDQLLVSLPVGGPVPWDQRNRLYEMAQALAFAGPAAKDHVGPLKELMNREVESNATIFGMVSLPPRRMCPLLEQILQVPITETEYTYCDPSVGPFGLEQ
ncbi:hypothetical protein [Devosia enhydra]|nr:hypothetical protein [Devosia enhydra]